MNDLSLSFGKEVYEKGENNLNNLFYFVKVLCSIYFLFEYLPK